MNNVLPFVTARHQELEQELEAILTGEPNPSVLAFRLARLSMEAKESISKDTTAHEAEQLRALAGKAMTLAKDAWWETAVPLLQEAGIYPDE